MKRTYYELQVLPDITLPEYLYLGIHSFDDVLQAQDKFFRLLYRSIKITRQRIQFICRYVPDNLTPNHGRIHLYLVVFGDYFEFESLYLSSSISKLYKLNRVISPPNHTYTYCCKLQRKTRRYKSSNAKPDEQPIDLFYVDDWGINNKARLYDMLKYMERANCHCCYQVDFMQSDELLDYLDVNFFQKYILKIKAFIKETGKRHFGLEVDKVAQENIQKVEKKIENLKYGQHLLVSVQAFSDRKLIGSQILDFAGSEIIENGDYDIYETIEPHNSEDKFYDFSYHGDDDGDNTEYIFSYLTNFWTLQEVSPFCRFPILGDDESLTLQKETECALTPDDDHTISFAQNQYDHKVSFATKQLSKHMFVSGVPGSGKTNTLLDIAYKLNTNPIEKIPFIIFEPAKREYHVLGKRLEMKNLLLFEPKINSQFPLYLNPLEFPMGFSLSQHITKLKEVFTGSFYFPSPTQYLLGQAIEATYEMGGWKMSDINNGKKKYPTMRMLVEQCVRVSEISSYAGEMKANIQGVLKTRMEEFLKRDFGKIFDTASSSLRPEEWIEHPIVVDLEPLGKDAANFVTLVISLYIRETLSIYPNCDKTLRHVIFYDEAHNLIGPSIADGDEEHNSPKKAATRFLVDMLAEVRALKEGIVIADQLPSAMAPEILKNTNFKITHCLMSEEDRTMIGSSISANQMQLTEMAYLPTGYAFFSYQQLKRPVRIKVDPWSTNKEEYNAMSESDLKLWSRRQRVVLQSIKIELGRQIPYQTLNRKNLNEEAIRKVAVDIRQYFNRGVSHIKNYMDDVIITLQSNTAQKRLISDIPELMSQLTNPVNIIMHDIQDAKKTYDGTDLCVPLQTLFHSICNEAKSAAEAIKQKLCECEERLHV